MENGERRREGIGAKWKLSTGIEMKVQIGKWQQRHRVEPTGSFDEKQLPQPHNSYNSPSSHRYSSPFQILSLLACIINRLVNAINFQLVPQKARIEFKTLKACNIMKSSHQAVRQQVRHSKVFGRVAGVFRMGGR